MNNRGMATDYLYLHVYIDIENMKLWPPLLSQLNAEEPEIRKGVAWVCGTAMQNNPKAQEAVRICENFNSSITGNSLVTKID